MRPAARAPHWSLLSRMAQGLPGALAVLAVAAAGCSSGDETEPTQPTRSAQVGCSGEARAAEFVPGLVATSPGGSITIEVVSGDPAPPRSGAGTKGVNEGGVKVTDATGAPYAGDLVVETLMPDHGHGSPRAPQVEANGDGTATIKDLFFFMGGLWQVTFRPAAAPQDGAVISVCAE